MKKTEIDKAIDEIRKIVEDIDGAEVNICEEHISFLCNSFDGEFILDTVGNLIALAKAIKVIENFKA